jgi:hypothetical protein
MAKAPKNPLKDLEGHRRSLGENQATFWGRFGVTQSGGSRYESGRTVPLPTAMLVAAYAQGLLDDEALKSLRKLVK